MERCYWLGEEEDEIFLALHLCLNLQIDHHYIGTSFHIKLRYFLIASQFLLAFLSLRSQLW